MACTSNTDYILTEKITRGKLFETENLKNVSITGFVV